MFGLDHSKTELVHLFVLLTYYPTPILVTSFNNVPLLPWFFHHSWFLLQLCRWALRSSWEWRRCPLTACYSSRPFWCWMINEVRTRSGKNWKLVNFWNHRHCPTPFTYSIWQKGYFHPFPLTVGIQDPLVFLSSCSFTLFHHINRLDNYAPSTGYVLLLLWPQFDWWSHLRKRAHLEGKHSSQVHICGAEYGQ